MTASRFFDDDETGKISNTLKRVTKEPLRGRLHLCLRAHYICLPPSVAEIGIQPNFDVSSLHQNNSVLVSQLWLLVKVDSFIFNCGTFSIVACVSILAFMNLRHVFQLWHFFNCGMFATGIFESWNGIAIAI